MSMKTLIDKSQREPLAIVGIGCRFPGEANDPESFWELLKTGVDAVTEIPEDRWAMEKYYNPVPGAPGKTYSRWGGFIKGIDQFEPEHFGISPSEASYMDPQQRLLLEVAWEALEDAGQVIDRKLGMNAGVFIGISTSDYAQIQSSSDDNSPVDAHTATGGVFSIAANRISYCLNLRGPSIAVDTACSSSLVAADLACRSLWNGECDLVLAGGVNIIIGAGPFVAFSAASMLSPDGRCKAFDASANGFVRGEGAGIIVLKPLSKALADGNSVYAVIVGSAVNQDGRTSGITVPSQSAQEALLREACRQGGIDGSAVHYVEAHGTGTAVGDPIEAAAMGNVLSSGRPRGRYSLIGSVKTNIGHLEAAAGIAGVIKVALSLKHRMIPRNLHFHNPNPKIPFEDLQLRVPLCLEPWPDDSGPAIAGVNSFGFGGTNAHMLLMEYRGGTDGPIELAREDSGRAMLMPLSARIPEALQTLARSYQSFLRGDSDDSRASISGICYTAGVGRTHFDHRLSLIVHNREELEDRLDGFLAGEKKPGMSNGLRRHSHKPKIAFVFSGQGPQWWGMGRELLAEEPLFRKTIEECDKLLGRYADWSILEELTTDEACSRLQETAIAQPALFSLQVALAALWKSWGIEPEAVVGHSVGEAAAAHVAGALSLEDAVRVIFHRGRCMDLASSKGRMLAVGLTMSEAEREIQGYQGRVSLAAINSPSSATLSGEPESLEQISWSLEQKGIFCKFLQVNYAFHSAQMEPIRGNLLESLDGLQPRHPVLPIISTVTGKPMEGRCFDRDYWWQNVRQRVRFAEAVGWLIERDYDAFLELSPHPVLSSSITECLLQQDRKGTVLPSLRRHEEERAVMLSSLGELYTMGHAIDWQRLWSGGGRRVYLPRYPWQRQHYWHESEDQRERRLGRKKHALLGRNIGSANPTWDIVVEKRLLRYLEDHKVQGHVVVPAAAFVEMALGGAREIFGAGACVLEEIQFQKAIFLPDEGETPAVQLVCYPDDGSFAIHSRASRSDQSWMLHTNGYLRKEQDPRPYQKADLGAIKHDLPEEISSEECYRRVAEMGLQFGPSFQGIERIWRKDGEALGLVRLNDHLEEKSDHYCFHPAFLDSCFQVLSGTLPEDCKSLYLPVQIERAGFYGSPGRQVWSHVHLKDMSAKSLEGDIRIYDPDGVLLMEIEGFRCQAVQGIRGGDLDDMEKWFYEVKWHHKPRPDQKRPIHSANYIPPSREIANSVTSEVDSLVNELGWVKKYSGLYEQLDVLSAAYVLQALRDLGWQFNLGDRITLASLMEQLVPRHYRVMGRYIRMLEKAGYLKKSGIDEWVIYQKPPGQGPQIIWQHTLFQYPAFVTTLDLMGRIGSQLADILRGDVDPLQLIFPEGSNALAEHFYQDSPQFRLCNTMIQKAVTTALGGLPETRTVRILEIGGGTGGMTKYVLPRLPEDRTKYVFSDISSLFLSKAEQVFRDYPFVSYQSLDIERDPLQQGFEPHSFDIILASDVMHATSNLRDSLGNIQKLISSEGLLIFLETEKERSWIDLVFGLMEGWWRFTDFDLRRDYPLIDRVQWKDVLEEVGFSDVADMSVYPDDQIVMLTRGPLIEEDRYHMENQTASELTNGERGSWLIFADKGGMAQTLVELLEVRGESCILVATGDRFQRINEKNFQISPNNPEDMERLLQALFSSNQLPWHGVIHLWSLDAPPSEETTIDSLRLGEVLGCHSVMHFIQALSKLDRENKSSNLILVTRGAQPLRQGAVSVGQSPLIGLGTVIGNEHPNIRCKMVDLSPDGSPDEVQSLFAELWTVDAEDEVALRHEARFVPRLERAIRAKVPAEQKNTVAGGMMPYRLEISTSGVIDNLTLHETKRYQVDHGQVEIEVFAAALNFRDVMKALGLYPTDGDDYMMLGDECAGRVVALGEGVEDFKVGDEVIAIAPGSFGSYARTLAEFVVRKPEHLSFEEAVTFPIAFLTAYYSLHHLAQITAGERVLIHSAAGGVGLAALQIARQAGAEVFATAGSPEKRELLRFMGVQHVMDSRSLSFADEILEITGGRGVDVVLNSLAGKAIAKGVSCLAPYGRFLELGKRDIYQNSKLGLRAFRKNLSFFAIDLSRLLADKPLLIRSILTELYQQIEGKVLHPLPHRVYPASRIVDAFRYMAQAKHSGKIVISMQDEGVLVEPLGEDAIAFRPDASYLITGGLGGFGLAVAKWIVENGGQNVVLVGRHGAESEETKNALESLQSTGARIVVTKADVTSVEQVADILTQIDRTMPPLKGIFHAAMVLDDGVLIQLDQDRFRKVMAPKVEGAWNLHSQSLNKDLDFFVLFSSVVSLFGNPGQGNYVAANLFLDALAHHRRSLGLPAVSINWGHLTEVGYVSRHQDVSEHLTRRGILGFPPNQAMKALGRILKENPVQMGVMRLDWKKLAGLASKAQGSQRLSSLMGQNMEQQMGEEESGIREALMQAKPEERRELVQTYICEQVAGVLGTSVKLDFDQPLNELGLDSLMAVQLQHRVENDLALSLPAGKLMQGPASINRLSTVVLNELGGRDSIPADIPTVEISQGWRPQNGRSRECLVPLRTHGTRPPLFCIHPAGGQIDIYKNLIDLLPAEQPGYGVQSSHLFDPAEDRSMESKAIECAKVIREQQPNGPYCLFGFSLGGFLAMSIARVLELQGQDVALVGLVDCDVHWADPLFPRHIILQNRIADMYSFLSKELGILEIVPAEQLAKETTSLSKELLSSSGDGRVDAVIDWLTKQKYVRRDIPADLLKEQVSRIELHISLIENFKPEMIRAPIFIWWARDRSDGIKHSDKNWDMYTSGMVVEETIEGGHYAVMYPPRVNTIAEQLDKGLQAIHSSKVECLP